MGVPFLFEIKQAIYTNGAQNICKTFALFSPASYSIILLISKERMI